MFSIPGIPGMAGAAGATGATGSAAAVGLIARKAVARPAAAAPTVVMRMPIRDMVYLPIYVVPEAARTYGCNGSYSSDAWGVYATVAKRTRRGDGTAAERHRHMGPVRVPSRRQQRREVLN